MEKALLQILNNLREFNAGEYLGAHDSFSESYIPILQIDLESELPNLLAFMKTHKNIPQEVSDLRDELKEAFWYVERLYGFRIKSKWHTLYYQIKTWLHYIDGYYPQENNNQLIDNGITSLTNKDIDEIWGNETDDNQLSESLKDRVVEAETLNTSTERNTIVNVEAPVISENKRPYKIKFDILKLYTLLNNEGVIDDNNEELLITCLCNANVNELWKMAGKNKKRNQLKCVIRYIKDK